MSIEEKDLKEVAALILRLHAQLPEDESGRTELKRRILAESPREIADLLMIYDAVAMGRKNVASITYNFRDNNIANANFGTQLGVITSNLEVLQQKADNKSLVEALKNLTEQVVDSKELDEEKKREVLDNLGFLGSEANQPKEKQKTGVIRSVLDAVPKILSAASSLATLWHTYGPVIKTFFGL